MCDHYGVPVEKASNEVRFALMRGWEGGVKANKMLSAV